MDIALILDKLRPGAKWRMADTYDNLVATWEDATSIPSEAELETAWLDIVKGIKKEEINIMRNTKEQGVFIFADKFYDCDTDSIQHIVVAAQNAVAAKIAGESFEIVWTLADNSTIVLDADGMLGLLQALGTHVTAIHYTAKQLKRQADSAATLATLEAISWPEE